MSSFLNFLTTYKRVLKIAYQASPSLLILVIVLNALWGLTNLPVLYINKLLIDTVIAGIGNPIVQSLKIIGLLLLLRTLLDLLRYAFSNWNNALRTHLTRLSNKYISQVLGQKLNSLDIPTVESP